MKFCYQFLIASISISACIAEPQHLDQPARIADGSISENPSEGIESAFELGWTSRYLAEGREVWNDNGIFSTLAVFGYENFALELWQGWSTGSADREIQGSLQYTALSEPLSVTFGLTHINSTRGGDDDLDASVSFAAPLPYGFEWDAAFYYGFDRHGFYLETGFSRTWEADWVDFTLGAHLGSNFGYVVEGHAGTDHFVVSADISKSVSECVAISVGIAQHFQIKRDPARNAEDLELFNGTIFGFAAEYSF